MQLVRLVQRDLKAARGDLHRTGKTRGRRIDDGERVGRHSAGLGDMLHERNRRSAVRFKNENRAIGLIAIAQLVEEVLRGAKSARWAGAQHMIFLALLLDRKAPA